MKDFSKLNSNSDKVKDLIKKIEDKDKAITRLKNQISRRNCKKSTNYKSKIKEQIGINFLNIKIIILFYIYSNI